MSSYEISTQKNGLRMQKNFSQEDKKTDQRKQTRVEEIQKVNYRILKPLKGEGFIQNLSEEGCCILLNEKLPLGSIIELEFEEMGNNSKPVKTLGKIVWQKNYIAGIKFIC